MEMSKSIAGSHKLILDDNRHFIYTINPVEINNFLGASIAILQEYSISGTNGENYKLYKTEEGNWYDIAEKITTENHAILRALKVAIDAVENTG